MNSKNSIRFLCSIVISLLCGYSYAQSPSIEWQRMLGGIGTDEGYSVCQTTDSGFVVAGRSNSYDGDIPFNHSTTTFDAWVVKLSKTGSIEWQRAIGGAAEDEATCVKQTSDGGFIVAGFSMSTNGDVAINKGGSDFMVVKLNPSGNIEWLKTYGGAVLDRASYIEQTIDGGFVVAGRSNSYDGDVIGHHGSQTRRDLWVIKLDNLGNLQWQNSLGGSEDESCTAIHQTDDGGYIVSGYTNSNDHDVSGLHSTAQDGWVVKLDSVGVMQWQNTLGGTASDQAKDVVQAQDGGYMVAAFTASTDGDVSAPIDNSGNAWLVKLDTLGNIIWDKSFGGSDSDWSMSIGKTNDNGFIIGGGTWSNDGDVSGNHGLGDCWVFKIDSIGTLQWSKLLGGSGNDELSSIQQTKDGGIVFCGSSTSNNGDVSGLHGGSGSMEDIWVVKLGPEPIGLPDAYWLTTFAMYPNPATDKLYVRIENKGELYTISLYDLAGKELKQISSKDQNIFELELNDVAAGIYLLKVASGKSIATRKVVVQH